MSESLSVRLNLTSLSQFVYVDLSLFDFEECEQAESVSDIHNRRLKAEEVRPVLDKEGNFIFPCGELEDTYPLRQLEYGSRPQRVRPARPPRRSSGQPGAEDPTEEDEGDAEDEMATLEPYQGLSGWV